MAGTGVGDKFIKAMAYMSMDVLRVAVNLNPVVSKQVNQKGKRKDTGVFSRDLADKFNSKFDSSIGDYKDSIDEFSKALETASGPGYKDLNDATVKGILRRVSGGENNTRIAPIHDFCERRVVSSSVPLEARAFKCMRIISGIRSTPTKVAFENLANEVKQLIAGNLTGFMSDVTAIILALSQNTIEKLWYNVEGASRPASSPADLQRSKTDFSVDVDPEELIERKPAMSFLSFMFNTMLESTFSFAGYSGVNAARQREEYNEYKTSYDQLVGLKKSYLAKSKDADISEKNMWDAKIREIDHQISSLNDNYNASKKATYEERLRRSIKEIEQKKQFSATAIQIYKRIEKWNEEKDKHLSEIEKKQGEIDTLEKADKLDDDGSGKKKIESLKKEMEELRSKIDKINKDTLAAKGLITVLDQQSGGTVEIDRILDKIKEQSKDDEKSVAEEKRKEEKFEGKSDKVRGESFDLTDLLVLD